jgi:hypothetical protein
MTFSQGFFYPFKVICVFTLKPSKTKTKNRLALKGFFVFSFYLNSKVTGLPFKLKKNNFRHFGQHYERCVVLFPAVWHVLATKA